MGLLSKELKNFCTIVTNEHAGVDQEGAVRHDFSYTMLKSNVRCAIQGKNRINTELEFGKKGEAIIHVFYHESRDLINLLGPHCIILTHSDFFSRLPLDMSDIREIKDKVRVFEFIGQRNPVGHETIDVPLEIYGEENFRWKF